MKEKAIEILNKINKFDNPQIIITTHHKPDGDAMGSSLGLHLFLKQLNLNSIVITPTDYADFFNWMPGQNDLIIYEGNESKCNELISNSDFIFCLDFNHLDRINEMGKVVENSKCQTILIDHHQYPQGFENYNYWDETASSTSELIYRFISDTNNLDKLNTEIAQCLYTGIMTDTGSFKFSNCNFKTHEIVANLLKTGINHVQIHEKINDSFEFSRIKFIGYVLHNKLEIIEECKTALISINKEELERFNIKTGDTEGLVNYGLSIRNITFAILVIDRTKLVKMSFRSKGKFAANTFAINYFNGGGHFYAAGGSSYLSLEETIVNIKNKLILHQNELQNSI